VEALSEASAATGGPIAVAVDDAVLRHPSLESAPAAASLPATRPRVAEAWLGRAGVCWLVGCLPLLATDLGTGQVAGIALVSAAVWFAAALAVEESGRERRIAFGAGARASFAALAGLVALSAIAAWAPAAAPPARALVASAALLAACATAWEVYVRRSRATAVRLLVVGSPEAALRLVDELPSGPYAPVAVVCDEPPARERRGLPTFGGIDALPGAIRAFRPDLIVLACDRERERVFDALLEVGDAQTAVCELAEFHEVAFGQLPVRQLTPAWFAGTLHLYRRPYGRATKRAFDVAVATVGLVLTAPLIAAVALVLRCTGGQVIYRQRRRGLGGEPFTILKFRTMTSDAERPGEAVWASVRDPRTTRVGRVLRALRIDELPQLVNVLQGTMSIVGPRPERPEYFDVLAENIPFWSGRTLVKPGITGWAQVNAGYASDYDSSEAKLGYDLWYLRHRSLLVDVAICARTFGRLTAGAR
jgi:exopolysaccharide biosynthesis polyprenyl glycosylphosphotransferase